MGNVIDLNVKHRFGSNHISHNGEIIPIIKYRDMPRIIIGPFERRTWDDYDDYIFSLYKGVAIQWDEDRDPRVLTFIDELDPSDRSKLLSVMEAEGTLSLLWWGHVPERYNVDASEVNVCGDIWSIGESVTNRRELRRWREKS